MLQDILVLIIIWTAIVYTVYQLVKTLIPSKNKISSKCNGCTGCALKTKAPTSMTAQYKHLNIRE